VEVDGFCCEVERFGDVRGGCDNDSKAGDVATLISNCAIMTDLPGGLMTESGMTAIGGVFRLEARSANGLSSSMKGEPPK
jgi:hypothetical protein